MDCGQVILECRNICKSFGKNKVLRDINLKIFRGEVHALLGQNGAGKSTLVKIITGVYTLDEGEIYFNGTKEMIRSPQDAENLGISIIHQDQQMVPYFDVTRNAYLGFEIVKNGVFLDFKTMRSNVSEKLKYIQAEFNADQLISTLSVGQREQVAIVSALLQSPKLLILDEPTASLSNREIERLFEIINLLKKNGVTIIYISHHLDEVFKIADSITVLRDSQNQGTMATGSVDRKKIITMMIGRELKEQYPKEKTIIGKPILEIKNLHAGNLVNGVNITLHEGEILGLAGLVGAGRTETMLAAYGVNHIDCGEIEIEGKKYVPRSPLFSRKHGIALIPEDRRNQGIVADLGIAQNLSLAFTYKWARKGIIDRKTELLSSKKIIKELNINSTDAYQQVSELSGGNQQKVVIGRWMVGNSKIFIFDQPTTGVDVGAKTEIYKQMIALAKNGSGIIFISSENEELLGICDRIDVMAKGKVVKEFKAGEASEKDLLFWSSGSEDEDAKEIGSDEK